MAVTPLSYWHDSLSDGDDLTPPPALPGDRDADVAIVGAGFTGLWTAHSLLRADPGLRVVVLEREVAGFGASGGNGGWCVGDAWTLLDAERAAAIVDVPGILGAVFTPHAATVHPARLARGLACEVERLGGTIHERTTVRSLDDRVVHTDHGTVRADVVVRGTEAYTSSLEGHEREVLPLGNYMVATEPIDDTTWAGIGLADRELFELSAVMLGYGQRTADGRIAWGGLAGPSWWGGRVPPSPMRDQRVAARLRRMLVRLFPSLAGIGFTHHWGGVLGVPRDLLPGIGYDRDSGFAWSGGYTGQGVAAANAAGRGLADLIRGVDSDLARLPWVGHRSRRWEPEPIRWLAVHTVASLARITDARDRRRGARTG